MCAEQYTPSPYSDPNYKPQQGYPAPPMDISQPVSYPQHAVRTIILRCAKYTKDDGSCVSILFVQLSRAQPADTRKYVALLYSAGVANGNSLTNMAAILSSSSPVRSGTRLHMALICPR